MVIPGSRENMRQFTLSYLFIISCAVIIVGSLIANMVLTASFVNSEYSEMEVLRLQKENRLLVEKYEEMNGQVAEINSMYDQLIEKEIVIRNIFSLPEISGDERQLGIGGPSPDIEEHLTESIEMAYHTQANVDNLLRLSRYEREKFEEIFNTLVEKKSILDHTPSIMPCKGYKTRGYGMKYDPFTGYKRFHHGLDIGNKTGTPIYATADGIVSYANNTGGDIGLLIKIKHGYGFMTKYGHLSKIKVKQGQKIRRGDLIGLMGSTGYSTGPHLHYEVLQNNKTVNPLKYIISK